jgi:hypothetical protein
MISDDCFLRRLPAGLVLEERMTLESLVFATDMACGAVHRMFAVAERHDPRQAISSARLERISLFSDAWKIVDSVHQARTILKTILPNSSAGEIEAFLSVSEPATLMRNAMDHVAGNMKNHSNKRGNADPFFGTVRWLKPDPLSLEKAKEQGEVRTDVIILMSGSSPGDAVGMITEPGMTLALPISCLSLSAFDRKLMLQEVVVALVTLVESLAPKIEQAFQRNLAMAEISDEQRAEAAKPANIELSLSATVGLLVDPDNKP